MSFTTVVIITPVPLDDVLLHDRTKYNSNNHWPDDIRPSDYEQKLEKTYCKHWIDKFHRHYHVINIYNTDLKWMKEAAKIGAYSGKTSAIHQSDIDDLVEIYQKEKVWPDQEYFVRTDSTSLKYGRHGAGPYRDIRSVIESLITSTYNHSPLSSLNDETQTTLKIYLMPWKTIDLDKEFRVFVYKKKITAISQQHLYTPNATLNAISSTEERYSVINNWVAIINREFHSTIKDRLAYLDSYVMDIAILENDIAYFIEINCFGKEYASGSSLFHWLINEEILYNDKDDTVHFRYTH